MLSAGAELHEVREEYTRVAKELGMDQSSELYFLTLFRFRWLAQRLSLEFSPHFYLAWMPRFWL